MNISIIVAHANQGVIGANNQMLWHLPDDLAYFKLTTLGHCVVMGRKTYQSIGRLLPGRKNIIITRNQTFKVPEAEVVNSLQSAIALASELGHKRIFIIGGGQIYEQALPLADELHITQVSDEVEGDTFFPAVDYNSWTLVKEQHFNADAHHKVPFVIRQYKQK